MPERNEGEACSRRYLERQHAVLERMLKATRDQRRHLIEGNAAGLHTANQTLEKLLACQTELHREAPPIGEYEPELLAEVRRLAAALSAESHTNYLLACRGAQFTGFALSLISGSNGDGGTASGPEPAPPERSPQAVDALS